MPTLSLNSKKCSMAESLRRSCGTTGATAVRLLLFFCLVCSPQARASSVNKAEILSDIRHHATQNSFDALLSSWEKRYGTPAVPILVGVAQDKTASDSERYVAVMGIAKIGGKESAHLLTSFLKDKSWMVRDGTLRALSALNQSQTAPAILPLVNDAALVVRLEAIRSVEKLRPEGSARALLAAIIDPINYHRGKAQWVPQKALEVLQHMKTLNVFSQSESHEAAMKLAALLENSRDPSLKPQIAATLRTLNEE
jgi:HEAT repeat protein